MNPHLRVGQAIPGVSEGRGIGIIEARVLPQLLDGVVLLAGSDAWTAADAAGLHAWMRAYLTWLLESPHGKGESQNGNTHETWYDVQVASLALYTNQEEVAAWRSTFWCPLRLAIANGRIPRSRHSNRRRCTGCFAVRPRPGTNRATASSRSASAVPLRVST